MGAFSRAQRRKAKHAYGLKTDEQANAILAVLENESAIKAERLKAVNLLEMARPKLEEDLRDTISGEFITLLAAFLRDKWGWGLKRTRRTIDEFMTFTADMAANNTTLDLLVDFLKDEIKYDLAEHLKERRVAEIAEEAEA